MTEKGPNIRARFFKENAIVYVGITCVGSKDEYVGKATPAHLAQFPAEYAAFEKGQDEPDVGGTPILEVPGITKDIAKQYKLKGIRNAEELAALTDAACSGIGLGALTARKAAQNLLAAKRAETLEAQLAALQAQPRKPGRPKKEQAAA